MGSVLDMQVLKWGYKPHLNAAELDIKHKMHNGMSTAPPLISYLLPTSFYGPVCIYCDGLIVAQCINKQYKKKVHVVGSGEATPPREWTEQSLEASFCARGKVV